MAATTGSRFWTILSTPFAVSEPWENWPGELNGPTGVSIGVNGIAYVVDYGNNKVQLFQGTSAIVSSIGLVTDTLDKRTWATATITVTDSFGQAVPGATVLDIGKTLTMDADSGDTGADGTLTVESESAEKAGRIFLLRDRFRFQAKNEFRSRKLCPFELWITRLCWFVPSTSTNRAATMSLGVSGTTRPGSAIPADLFVEGFSRQRKAGTFRCRES